MNKLLLTLFITLFLCISNITFGQSQVIPSIINQDITIGGADWTDISISDSTKDDGNVTIRKGIPDNTTVTFDHRNAKKSMSKYSIIDGDLTIEEDQIIIIEPESYLIINGDLINNGVLNYNNKNDGNSTPIYLVVLGYIKGSGIFTGNEGKHDEPPYATGIIIDGDTTKATEADDIGQIGLLPPFVEGVVDGIDNIIGGIDLPVKLISFTATPKEDKVHLAWSTASEINASHFEIYSSNNGVNWNLLGTKEASGNSNVQIDYAFTDNTPYNNTSFYKLVQYDFDGKNETFGPLKVSLSNTQNLDMSIFPNPSSDVVNIQVSGMKGSKLEIQVITKEGQIVSSETLETDAVQSYMYRIGNDKKLQPGFYFIKTKSGSEEKIDKIIIQ